MTKPTQPDEMPSRPAGAARNLIALVVAGLLAVPYGVYTLFVDRRWRWLGIGGTVVLLIGLVAAARMAGPAATVVAATLGAVALGAAGLIGGVALGAKYGREWGGGPLPVIVYALMFTGPLAAAGALVGAVIGALAGGG